MKRLFALAVAALLALSLSASAEFFPYVSDIPETIVVGDEFSLTVTTEISRDTSNSSSGAGLNIPDNWFANYGTYIGQSDTWVGYTFQHTFTLMAPSVPGTYSFSYQIDYYWYADGSSDSGYVFIPVVVSDGADEPDEPSDRPPVKPGKPGDKPGITGKPADRPPVKPGKPDR